jgi:hypothetical protein
MFFVWIQLVLGARVRRGPDWMWGEQDGGGTLLPCFLYVFICLSTLHRNGMTRRENTPDVFSFFAARPETKQDQRSNIYIYIYIYIYNYVVCILSSVWF